MRHKRADIVTVGDVVEDEQPLAGPVQPFEHRLNDPFLVVRGRERETERLRDFDESRCEHAGVLGVDPEHAVGILGPVTHCILDRSLRLAGAAEPAHRGTVMFGELHSDFLEQRFAPREIARAHRVGNQPRSLERAPPAPLWAERTERRHFCTRLAKQMPHQAFEAAIVADLVEVAAEDGRHERERHDPPLFCFRAHHHG